MKRLLCILTALTLVLMLSLTVYADVVVDIGDWSISRTSTDKSWEIRSYNGTETDISLLNSYSTMNVTSLGSHAFSGNASLTRVVFNKQMQGVKEYAFLNCGVAEIVLNSNLLRIERGAFSGTEKLKSINLDQTRVQVLNEYAFLNSGISQIALPQVMKSIGTGAFMQCSSLVRIDIPDSVTEIADTAFDGCDNVVIYANGDSYAIEYAIANGIDYIITDAPVEVTYMVGDADGDGAVSILDATKIQRVLADLDDDPDGMIALRADSDSKGLDILDATRIQRYLADFEVSEPIGETVTTIISAD